MRPGYVSVLGQQSVAMLRTRTINWAGKQQSRGRSQHWRQSLERSCLNTHGVANRWFVALFPLGCMPFTMPLLSLFAHNGEVLRIPMLFAEIFATWISPLARPIILVERSRLTSVA